MASIFIFITTCIFILFPSIALETNSSLPSSSESTATNKNHLQTYIVHVKLPHTKVNSLESQDLESWYQSFLPTTLAQDSNHITRMVHSYQHVFTGFAVRLSPKEVKSMAKKEGFMSAVPEKVLSLQTTRSPGFIGLQQNIGFWRNSSLGRGMIIGVLDSGVTPNHPSFSGNGVPQPPAKWKGRCFLTCGACNNKLIGARTFFAGDTPVDQNGHGTHTASTAAGNFVSGANVFGQASGTASGIAPLAHLAIYKVCLGDECNESAILAGMDAAIGDGVDVLSISLGINNKHPSIPFYNDNIAIGAFAATQRGIFVSCAAANVGPIPKTLSNEAPWILTVGASTIDRNFRATTVLGNRVELNGESLNQPNNFPTRLLPLVYPGRTRNQQDAWCFQDAFNNVNVRGMVVVCDDGGQISSVEKGINVRNAGGAAMILVNRQIDGYSISIHAHVLPTTQVSYLDGTTIKTYINSTPLPQATIIFNGTILGVKDAPEVASFSSRGPSQASPGILKPDIVGPGVNILAAWPFSVDGTTTRATFNIISGTSMATPHLSGTAALLKVTHPNWSPAAIKSAIMTTANPLKVNGNPIADETKQPANWFALGAGHVIPSRANDPGLVYDIHPNDYIPYMCGLGYTNQQVNTIVRGTISCSNGAIPEGQLNYPSFSIMLRSGSQTYSRTVTNVGEASSSYTVSIDVPSQVNVAVTPTRLDFNKVNQQLTYRVTFSRSVNTRPSLVNGYLTWTSTRHQVKSPISIKLM